MSLSDDIPIIISIIAIILAALSLFISYKNRAFRIKIYKNHTAALKRIAEDWQTSLPVITSIERLDDDKNPIHLEIEDDRFFKDLMENHIPEDLDIPKHWQELKQKINDLNAKKAFIHEGLIKRIEDLSGAKYIQNWPAYDGHNPDGYGFGFHLLSYIIRFRSSELNQDVNRWKMVVTSIQETIRINEDTIMKTPLDPQKARDMVANLSIR